MSKSQLLISSIFKTFFLSLCIISIATFAHAQTASILPNAKTTFLDSNGHPLTAGQVFFYIPGTTTPKTTWQDAAETIPNTNPVILDGAGRALILGSGSYRQRVTDKNGNLIWDQVTSSAAGGGGGGPTVGDGNAVGTILPWSGFVPPPNYLFSYGQELSRTTYSVLLAAITQVQNITCQSGSPTLTSVADTSQLPIGARVESACVSASSSVISKTVNTVTLNTNAIVSVTATATFFPWGEGNGLTTFNTPDLRGAYLPGRCNMGGASCSILSNPNYNDPNAINGVGGGQTATLALANIPPGITSSGSNNILVNPAGNPGFFAAISPGTISATSFATVASGPSPPASSSATWSGTAIFTGANNITVTSTGSAATPFANLPPSKTINYIIKVLPDTNIGTSSINQLAPGVPNELAGTDSNGIWGNVTVPTGLSVASSALNFNIPALTAQLTPSANNDYLILYNSASGTTQKVTVGLVASSATAGVSSFNGLTGAVTGISSIDGATGAVIGVDINSGRRVTTTPTVSNSDCNRPLYLGGNAQYTVTINSSDTYSAGCRFILINSDTYSGVGTGRGKIMTINSITQHPLYPGQQLTIRQCLAAVCGSNIWIPDQQVNGALGQFWLLANAPVFFVDPAGGSDTANDGLASGAANAFKTLGNCIVVVGQAQITRNGSTTFCKVTAGSSITEHVNILYYIQAPIPLQIQSTTNGTAFTWNCPSAQTCVLLGDYGNSQFQDINFVMADAPIIFQHQYGIAETLTNVTMTGNNGGFPLISCDTNSQLNIDNGLTYGGVASLIISACPNSLAQINGAIVGAGGATIGRFLNATTKSSVLFGGGVTFSGTAPGSASIATGQSLVVNSTGSNIPGGNPVPTTGAWYCGTGGAASPGAINASFGGTINGPC